jgi:hypothetical protein
MMKKIPYIFFGIAIGIMLTVSVGAYAATKGYIGKKITAEIPVYVDGQEIPEVAVVVDGKSFLPVRKTAEAADLGLELKDGKIYLETKKGIKEAGAGSVDGSINIKLIEVEHEIEGIKQLIRPLETAFEREDLMSDLEKEKKGEQLRDLKAKLAELETRKTTLEVQVTPTP